MKPHIHRSYGRWLAKFRKELGIGHTPQDAYVALMKKLPIADGGCVRTAAYYFGEKPSEQMRQRNAA